MVSFRREDTVTGIGTGNMNRETEIGATQSRKPRDTWSHQKQEEARKGFPQNLPRQYSLSNTLISDFWPPQSRKGKFIFYVAHLICGNLSQWL